MKLILMGRAERVIFECGNYLPMMICSVHLGAMGTFWTVMPIDVRHLWTGSIVAITNLVCYHMYNKLR